MSKVITMTEFLRNPKKVRALVSQNVKVYVMFEGKICMVITAPNNQSDSTTVKTPTKKGKIPTANIGIDVARITRDDIYNRNSWLDQANEN